MNEIHFSIIIPTYNRGKNLRETLKALSEQDNPGCKFEVIPVDNNSTDDTKDVILEFAKSAPIPIRYTHEKMAGSAYARNAGFRQAKGEIIGLIDDDIIVGKNWVKEITSPYVDSNVGAVGGKINLEWRNGSPPAWFDPYQSWLGVLDYGPTIRNLNPGEHINAGNYSIRRNTLFEAGGYPPCDAPGDKLIGDGECGLNSKVWESGKQIIWNPHAEVQHINNAQAITIHYMRKRSRHHGMGAAYSLFREKETTHFTIFKSVIRGLSQAAKNLLRSFQFKKISLDRYYSYLFKYEYSLWSAIYLLQILLDAKLKEAVLVNNWIEFKAK
jgi:glucosyl-dolichyl phosphate glucuronosyltransferase